MAGGSKRGNVDGADAAEAQAMADDADAYAGFAAADGPARGIADDADAFADLASREAPDATRSLGSRWLYRLEGAVFGPVAAEEVLELLYAGELEPRSEIAPEDGEFRSLERFGAFRAHVPKAEAARREREAAERRAAEEARSRRARRLRWAGVAAVAALLGSGLVYGGVRWRQAAVAAEEKALREARLEAEIATFLDEVTIEPPLRPLVRGASPAERGGRSTRRTRRRASGRRASRRNAGRSPPTGARSSRPKRGVLSDQEVHRGLRRAFPGLERCVKAQIRRAPDTVPARIVLRFAIDNAGRAKDVDLEDRFLRRSPMKPCFEARLSRVRWRPYRGEVRNVEYQMTVRRPS